MNVYDKAVRRIRTVLDDFDNVYVSFSGGKDSGVMLNLCADLLRQHYPGRRIGVLHLDYEAQYQMTTEYVDSVLASNPDIFDVYRICMPFKVPCSTSMHQAWWRPWEAAHRDIWVRPMPANGINEDNHPFDYWKPDLWDYDFQELFSFWYHNHKQATRTACLVGIRTQESLNRWRAIHSDRNYRKYQGYEWTRQLTPHVFNAYPIYDWLTEDIWTANARFGWQYNQLYDLFYQAGVPLEKMRVASPFIDAGQDSLKLYRAIDPNNWARMVGRVNGVNFTGIYGGTTAMGWQSIKLPAGHTWESYMHFLLSTLPADTRARYLEKLSTSMRFWREKGGVLSAETIDQLKASGIKIDVTEGSNYRTSKHTVRMDYLDEVDIANAKEIPTFKRMCICIMKNDHLCKYMGFSLTKTEMARRQNIMDKYKSLL